MVDTQGIADDAVDVEGWSYATDFGWLHMPPAAGAGKFRRVRLIMWMDCLSASYALLLQSMLCP